MDDHETGQIQDEEKIPLPAGASVKGTEHGLKQGFVLDELLGNAEFIHCIWHLVDTLKNLIPTTVKQFLWSFREELVRVK